MEKVIRDGKVAVIYSPGYGAGWFSWNRDHPQMLFHPEIVELIELGMLDDISEDFMKRILNTDEYVCVLGKDQLAIEWVDQGTLFKIDEYDGAEWVQLNYGNDWFAA